MNKVAPIASVHRGHVEARVESESIPEGRIASLRINPDGAGMGNCISCGKELRFDPPKDERLVEVACMGACAKDAGFFPERKYKPLPVLATRTVAVAEDEDGEAIPEDKLKMPHWQPKVKRAPCEKCGGQKGKGRGWDHQMIDGQYCPLSAEGKIATKRRAAAAKPVCPECGGPPGRSRGWKHKLVKGALCSLSTEGKLAKVAAEKAAKPKAVKAPKAPNIPGVRRGRKPLGLD